MNLDHADFRLRQLSAVPVRGTTVLHRKQQLSPAQQITNMCSCYFGIDNIEKHDPNRMISVPIGELDIALHAAFVAGMRYAERETA